MTFIITAVCVSPLRTPRPPTAPFVVRAAEQDPGAWARAGNLAALSRYFDEPVDGAGFLVLTDEGGGYETSNAFFHLGDDDDHPAQLIVPDPYRPGFRSLLSELLAASSVERVILIAEDNGHVTAPELTEEEIETIDRIGPVNPEAFWRLVELGEVYEDSLTVIEGQG